MAGEETRFTEQIFQGRVQGRGRHQIMTRAKNLVLRWGYAEDQIWIQPPCVHPVAPNGDAMVRIQKLDGSPQEFEAVVKVFTIPGTVPTPPTPPTTEVDD